LDASGLVSASDVLDGTVLRMPKAYPVYDSIYLESLRVIRNFLSRFDNLQLTGRNGMHKYNNQDHSMLTAMLAAKNILGANYDLWRVNVDQEYHEEIIEGEKVRDEFALLSSTQPLVPEQMPAQTRPQHLASDEVIIKAFARMDKLAFATAVGSVCGVVILISTLMLTFVADTTLTQGLQLLGQYFVGYTVTVQGAFIGTGYSFLWGFIFGWLFAYIRNLFLGFFLYRTRKKTESLSFKDLLDYI